MFLFGGIFEKLGADIAIAGALIMAPDMGGYQITESLASSPETWIIALFVSYCTGRIICDPIPDGIFHNRQEGSQVLRSGSSCSGHTEHTFRGHGYDDAAEADGDTGEGDYLQHCSFENFNLVYTWGQIWLNMLPIVVFCLILALPAEIFHRHNGKGVPGIRTCAGHRYQDSAECARLWSTSQGYSPGSSRDGHLRR